MNIHWLSNAPWTATGYGAQTKLFLPPIKSLGHDVSMTANYGLEGGILGWQDIMVYPRGYVPWGNDVVGANGKIFGADAIFTLMDSWVFEPNGLPPDMPWIPWFPVDSEPLPSAIYNKVSKAFARIVFSRFGERMVNMAGLDTYYVPHGYDGNFFKPHDTTKSRQNLGLPQDAYIVTIVGANKGNPPRKAWQQNIEGFVGLRRKHKDAFLFMHTSKGRFGENGGMNLPELLNYHGLQEGRDYAFCGQHTNVVGGYNEEHLAKLYSASDVFLLVSSGEGFGVPIIEAQACGCPVIVGDWTATGELCFSGWKIERKDAEPWWTPLATYQFYPHIGAITDALLQAYEVRGNQDYRTRAASGAKQYEVKKVTEKYWKPVLEDIAQRIEKQKPVQEPAA